MKKLLIFLLATLALSACEQPEVDENPSIPMPPNNEIWYTSSDNDVVIPNDANVFGANIVNNSYIDGKGVITFDGDVTTIGYQAFLNCDRLTSVTIPNSVTSIGDSAFVYCSSLTEFNGKFAEDNGRILVIGSTLIAFAPAGLVEYNIPDSVTRIGGYAFNYCTNLTSVTIPNSVTTIEYGTFRECFSLTEFKGKFAKDNGRILVIDGVLTAFAPAGLTEYTIPDSVTTIGSGAFYSCKGLTSVTIPDSVTTIEDVAFPFCTNLTSVTIPDSVTTIGVQAFFSCFNLSIVTIGDGVTSIGFEAFAGCRSLTSVTIGDNVTTIGEEAFYYCDSLTSVYCMATTPPSLGGTSVFDENGSGRKIYVPTESVNAYKSAANWSKYASAIVGYDF